MKSLKTHQTYALMCMEAHKQLGIFYDPGCGKTIIALAWCVDAIKSGKAREILVICPAALVESWKQAIEEVSEFEEFTEDDVELLKKHIFISSYNKLYRTEKKYVHHRDGTKTERLVRVLRDEVDKHWDAVFVDESHHIGAHDSLQTKICLKLAPLIEYRYIMTGTPVHGGGGKEDFSKMYSQFEFLKPGIFGTWTSFTVNYIDKFDRWGKPRAYKVDKCRTMMQSMAIAMKLEDCFDMPGYTETTINCPLVEKKVYQDVKKGAIAQYNLDVTNSGALFGKLLQIVSGHLLRDEEPLLLKTSKDDVLKELISGTESKVVVFCRFTESVDRVYGICSKIRKTDIFDGRSTTPTWMGLQKGDTEVLICQYASGGEGLNLQAANTLIFFEPTFSSRELRQAQSRLYRGGQTEKCRTIYLTTPKTEEEYCWDTVRNGNDVTNEMMALWSSGVVFE